MRLHLIRHGRTAANVDHLLDTRVPGCDLNDEGRAQAEALAERIQQLPVAAIYVSPIVRTQQTAEPLARQWGLQPVVLAGLREIQAGDLEMWPGYTEYLAVIRAWAQGEVTAARPGGEDGLTFIARFDQAIAEIAAAGHAEAAAISHGAAMGTWLGARAGGPAAGDDSGRHLGNTAVVTLDGDPASGWTIVDWHNGVAYEPTDDSPPGTRRLTEDEAVGLAPGWTLDQGSLRREFGFASAEAAADFGARAEQFAEAVNHHPDLRVQGERVQVSVRSHDVGGITHRDTAMANRLVAIATDVGF